jgi:hypothetical protein
MWICPQCRTERKNTRGPCPVCGFSAQEVLQTIPAVEEDGAADQAALLDKWPETDRKLWERRSKKINISRGATIGGYCGLIGVPCVAIALGLVAIISGEVEVSDGVTFILAGSMLGVVALVYGALFGFAVEASYRFFQGLFRKKPDNLHLPLYRADSRPSSDRPSIQQEQQEKLVDLKPVSMSESKIETPGGELNQTISPAGGNGPGSGLSVEKSPDEAGNSHFQPRRGRSQ